MDFRRVRDYILVGPLLAVPFFFLRSSIRNPSDMNALDRALSYVSTPIEFAAAAVARQASLLVGDYLYLVDVKSDNNRLVQQNARLEQQVRGLEQEKSENLRLRRLLGLRDNMTEDTATGAVISKNINEYFRIMRLSLDVPSKTITEHLPVISADGAVGTVVHVAGDKVDVQLIFDAGFGVDVVVERTKARAFVRGTGDPTKQSVVVEDAETSSTIDVGDILVTSGVGCRFPPGIPVARVTKVTRKDFKVYQKVEAEPVVDFSRLEEAIIVLRDVQRCEPSRTDSARR